MSRRSFSRGTPVRIRRNDGTEVRGQVWELSDEDGAVWVALEIGQLVKVRTTFGEAFSETGEHFGWAA